MSIEDERESRGNIFVTDLRSRHRKDIALLSPDMKHTENHSGGGQEKAKAIVGLVAGAITGSLEICITYPVKYIKTQLQLEEKLGSARKYSGMMDCARQTIRQHGAVGLYRGLNIFFYGPKASVRFGTFETLKVRFADENGNISTFDRFLCGVCAGAIEAAIVNTPLETIECKLIHDQRLDSPRFKSFLHGAKMILNEDGFKGLYRGIVPSVLKQASNQGIRFLVVESSKDMYRGGDPDVQVPKLMTGLFGGIAGVCSVFGNNPIDVIKTRMQGLDHAKYRNMLDCLVKIWRYEGFFSFYRGVTPRLGRVAIEVALTFMIYDIVQDVIAKL